jgi:hypothetical protein
MKKILFVLVTAAACGNTSDSTPIPSMSSAFVAAGDFMPGHPGTLAAIDTKTAAVTENAAPAGSVGDDPTLRLFGGEVFVINRSDGNNITILDAKTHGLVEQLATGAGSNPQDVAIKGDKLYVPTFQGKGLVVLTRGSTDIAQIDLSADDPDGEPNCVTAYTVGNDVYVACELLDPNFSPRDNGKIYVIDTATDTVKHTVAMQTKYPLSWFAKLPTGELVIGTDDYSTTFGTNNIAPGCIEKITTGASPASAGCILTNMDAGGNIGRIDVQALSGEHTMLWMTIAAPDFSQLALWSYDVTGKALAAAPASPASELIVDLAACPDGSLAVSDEAMNASGLRLYKAGVEVTTAALPVGLDTKSYNALACY